MKRFKICALPSVKVSFMKFKKQTKSSTYSFLPNKHRNLFCNLSSRPNSGLFIKRKTSPVPPFYVDLNETDTHEKVC